MMMVMILILLMSSVHPVAAWMVPPGRRPSRAMTTTRRRSLSLLAAFPPRHDQETTATTAATSTTPTRRRQLLRHAAAALLVPLGSGLVAVPPALAAPKGPPPRSVDECVAALQREIAPDGDGSVARLRAAVAVGDFAEIQAMTKGMDQSLRKQVVGQAKYYWSDDQLAPGMATQLSNNITFDLIGMNRNSRAGQEHAAGVQQYLDDLRTDLKAILVETEKAARRQRETNTSG